MTCLSQRRSRKLWPILGAIVCLSTLAYFAAAARAQPLAQDLDSIEWMAADSSLIVRGSILAVETDNERESFPWHRVYFRVEETIKGTHHRSLAFIVKSSAGDREIRQWRETRPVLVFLKESRFVVARWRQRKYSRYPFAPRTGHSSFSIVGLDPTEETSLYDLSLTAITDPASILKVTKEAAAAPAIAGESCRYWLNVPGGSLMRLAAPVDDRLEYRAKQWLRSEDKQFRREGVGALVFFRSEANADLLRGLFNDPGAWIHAHEKDGRIARKERVYEVREEAHAMLEAWGFEAPLPVIREPLRADN